MHHRQFLGDLRKRLLLLLLALVVPVALLTARGYVRLSENEILHARHNLQDDAHLIVADLQAQVESARHVLAVFAGMNGIGGEPAQCERWMRGIAEFARTLGDIAVFDADGNILCGSESAAPSVNVRDHDWFRRALRTREFTVSAFVSAGPLRAAPGLVFALPTLSVESGKNRVFSVFVSASRLRDLLAASAPPPRAVAWLVDAQGVTVARVPDHAAWLGRPVGDPDLMEVVRNRSQAGVVEAANGWTYVAMPVRDRERDLYVLLGALDRSALSIVNRTFLENIVAFAAVVLFVSAAVWFAADRIILRDVDNELRRGLLGTVTALANAVDARDPYTAGHQSRVAQLAVAIGEQMGLNPDRLEGLRLAALLHDIGKLAIPLDVLTKIGTLTPEEMELIHSHPRVGYAILKEVHFRWPVAEAVYQHHERLDGSGYPRGLKAEQILLEARILAVADVVEAMSASRPYRDALGETAALDWIRENAGRQFAPDVVAACVAVFRDRGFRLPSPRLREFVSPGRA